MSDMSVDEIVALITQKVMGALKEKENLVSPEKIQDSGKKILLLGSCNNVPEKLLSGAKVFDAEDFKKCKDAKKYDQIIISKLSLVQLADSALGKPMDEVSCAVVYGLLQGVEILIVSQGLSYKKYAGLCSRSFYALYEGYLQQLKNFGVKILDNSKPEDLKILTAPKKISPKLAANMTSGPVQDKRLITESDARQMVALSKGEILLDSKAIITPLAKDVFSNSRVKIVFKN